MIRDDLVIEVTNALSSIGVSTANKPVNLERPARPEHGDWSTNAALVFCKSVESNPRDLAAKLIEALEAANIDHVDAIEIAGPGFVNFRLANSWLHEVLLETVEAGEDFGRSKIGEGMKVNVEFVSANPTGPLHAGHGRGAVYGDAVARLFEFCGYEVDRECYFNDRGVQMELYYSSLWARSKQTDLPENGYKGEYVIAWGAELAALNKDWPDDADKSFREWAIERAFDSQKETFRKLGITFDIWTSERSLVAPGQDGKTPLDKTFEALRDAGALYESEEATWLKTEDRGDDKDRVVIKSDGDFTYLAPDIAYHQEKFTRADLLVNVLGADHHGYMARMHAALSYLGHDKEDLDFRILQLVSLQRDGEEVKISKRTGDVIELDDVIDEVGADVTRFIYLMQSIDTRQTFDLAAAVQKSMENPVYYVQYANARLYSILRKVEAAGVERLAVGDTDLALLTHERELEVLRVLSEFAPLVVSACNDRAPHRMVTWVRELASAFHGFYRDCYVVGDVAADLTQARLWLLEAARCGLGSGLGLLGVSAPEEM